MVLPFTRSVTAKTISEAGRYLREAGKALDKGNFLGAAAAYTNVVTLMQSAGSYTAGVSGREMQGYRNLLSTQRQIGARIVGLGMRASDGYLRPVAHTYATVKRMIGRPVVSNSREGMEAETRRNVGNAEEYLKAVNPLVASTLSTAENTARLTNVIAADLDARNGGNETLTELASRARRKLAEVQQVRAFLEGSPA